MKAFIRRIVCLISLLVFIASFVIFLETYWLNPYLFLILTLGSVIIFLYCIAEKFFEDDEKKE